MENKTITKADRNQAIIDYICHIISFSALKATLDQWNNQVKERNKAKAKRIMA